MIHIASLSSRGTCAIFSFCIAGDKGRRVAVACALISLSLLLAIKGGETSTIYIQYGPAYAVNIKGCAVNVWMLEGLTAITK